MKKIMSLVLAVTLLMSVFGGLTAFAADATSIPKDYTVEGAVADGNDAYGWKVDDDKTLKIYYTGNPVTYSKDDYTDRPWQDSVDTITEVVIEGTPTEIGARTFKGMKSLTKVTYSDEAKKTVTKINTEAFAETSINGVFRIPASVTYLHGQSIQSTPISALVFESSTTPIELHKGLQYLGDLTSIVLMRPAKITGSITTVKQFGGKYASGTYGMTAPSRINMLISDASYIEPFSKLADYKDYLDDVESNKKPNIASKEFSVAPGTFGKYTLIDSTEAILDGVFANNVWYLLYDENTDPNSVDYTVEFLTNGEEKGDNMTANGYSYDTSAIKKMVFGFGFTQIPKSFGTNYKALKELKLPTTMVQIGDFAFDGVGTMVKANFEDTKITDIGVASFRKSKFKELKFPSTLSQIKQKAFINNNVLECVYFPKASNLFLGSLVFARDDASIHADKNLKVIFDEVTSFSPSTNLNTFAADTTSSTDWRTTTIVYNAEKTTSLPNFNQVTKVENVYYEVSDTDNDNINLFMCNFADKQDYKLFMCTYDNDALDNIRMIKEDTLAKGGFINAEFNTSANVKEGNTKVFLWEGFANCKPLKTVLEK